PAARAAARSRASPACSARCRATARRRAASCQRSVLGLGLQSGSCHPSLVLELASSRCWFAATGGRRRAIPPEGGGEEVEGREGGAPSPRNVISARRARR